METPGEFAERFFSTPWGIDGHELLARMVEARDAEHDAAIRKEYESHPLVLVENERQKRIDETARAVMAHRTTNFAASDIFAESDEEADKMRASDDREIRLDAEIAYRMAEALEAERERRLARKDAPPA